MPNKGINTDIEHRVGGYPNPPRDDFEVRFSKDEDGFGTFELELGGFDRFEEYSKDTQIYVVLTKGNQSVMINCGLLQDFEESRSFILEEQKEDGQHLKTERVIDGEPNSAKVQFISPNGEKLYQWESRKRRPSGGTNGEIIVEDRDEFVGHVRLEGLRSILFVNFNDDVNYNEPEGERKAFYVEWKKSSLFWEDLTPREMLLMTQKIMGEMLNYIILNHLWTDGGIRTEIDEEERTSLSVIKQYLVAIDEDALEIFRQRKENVDLQQYMDWKKDMLGKYCEKEEILQKLVVKLNKS